MPSQQLLRSCLFCLLTYCRLLQPFTKPISDAPDVAASNSSSSSIVPPRRYDGQRTQPGVEALLRRPPFPSHRFVGGNPVQTMSTTWSSTGGGGPDHVHDVRHRRHLRLHHPQRSRRHRGRLLPPRETGRSRPAAGTRVASPTGCRLRGHRGRGRLRDGGIRRGQLRPVLPVHDRRRSPRTAATSGQRPQPACIVNFAA